MSANNVQPAPRKSWRRSFGPEAIVILAALIVLLFVHVGRDSADAAVPSASSPSASEQLAYTSEFSKVYNATYASYDGKSVFMVVEGQSYTCDAPPIEMIADRPTLRCETFVKPADTEPK